MSNTEDIPDFEKIKENIQSYLKDDTEFLDEMEKMQKEENVDKKTIDYLKNLRVIHLILEDYAKKDLNEKQQADYEKLRTLYNSELKKMTESENPF